VGATLGISLNDLHLAVIQSAATISTHKNIQGLHEKICNDVKNTMLQKVNKVKYNKSWHVQPLSMRMLKQDLLHSLQQQMLKMASLYIDKSRQISSPLFKCLIDNSLHDLLSFSG